MVWLSKQAEENQIGTERASRSEGKSVDAKLRRERGQQVGKSLEGYRV